MLHKAVRVDKPNPQFGSREREYMRTADLFAKIVDQKSAYFALAFLIDSQYCYEDLKKTLDWLKPDKEFTPVD